MSQQTLLYYSTHAALPERIPLRAGPLSLFFEDGDLRSIQCSGKEIIRRIYVAVRDRNWGTIAPVLSNVLMDVKEDAFHITYTVENHQNEIHFAWEATLRGDPHGTLTFAMSGAAQTTFLKNRIGFCVLFPAACAGRPAVVGHTSGTQEDTAFPIDICADQPVPPFGDMHSLVYTIPSGQRVEARFAGDVFEMEDQRLWTDASYKVFCTPLGLPYPAEISAGTRVDQSVTLSIQAAVATAAATAPTPQSKVQLELPAPDAPTWKRVPAIGLGAASHAETLTPLEIERIKALHLSHLRVDLALADPTYPEHLRQVAQEAAALDLGLEAALLISAADADSQLRGLRALLDNETLPAPILRWLIYPHQELYQGGSPTEAVLRAARFHLTGYNPAIAFAAGTNTDFIFLKRTPPPIALMDGVCIALNPQVHAFDALSLVETLEAQAMVVESARRLAGGLPVIVSPITLKPRHNPYATAAPLVDPAALPPQVDPRQASLFGAGWTLGSLGAMLACGAASLTYYETTGWRGVMQTRAGSPLPERFPSYPGAVHPLYHVLADIGEYPGSEGGEGAPLVSSHPQQVSGLALRSAHRQRILLANHTSQAQVILLPAVVQAFSARFLDETNALEAMQNPEAYRTAPCQTALPGPSGLEITLPPLACLCLDTLIS